LDVIPIFLISCIYVPGIPSNLAVLQVKGTFLFDYVPGPKGLGWIPASVGKFLRVHAQMSPFLSFVT